LLDAARFIHQALLDYKGVCRIWILNTPALWVSDSKIIKVFSIIIKYEVKHQFFKRCTLILFFISFLQAILSSTVNIEKATLYEAIKPILGSNGLIASEGELHIHRFPFNVKHHLNSKIFNSKVIGLKELNGVGTGRSSTRHSISHSLIKLWDMSTRNLKRL